MRGGLQVAEIIWDRVSDRSIQRLSFQDGDDERDIKTKVHDVEESS